MINTYWFGCKQAKLSDAFGVVNLVLVTSFKDDALETRVFDAII
jgi:hypothetical protein